MLLADVVDDLATLPITGVKRQYSAPPQQVSTADMPLTFPRVPRGKVTVSTLSGLAASPMWAVDLVCVLEAAGQSTQPTNFSGAVGMIDAMNAALEGYAAVGCANSWEIRQDMEFIGDTAYWVLIASVEAS